VISYHNATTGNLLVAHCHDANCSVLPTPPTISVADQSPDIVGTFTSLKLDGAGFPVISYYDATSNTLKLMHCDDVNCGGNNDSIRDIAVTSGVTEQYSSLALTSGSTRFPVISFARIGGNLAIGQCNDALCGSAQITTLDSAVTTALYTSLALDSNNLPVVSYVDSTTSRLKVARCTDGACTPSATEISIADNTLDQAFWSSLALDASGNPIIGSDDGSGVLNSLIVTRCVDPYCNPKRIRTVTP
jgi:hypothetical protein